MSGPTPGADVDDDPAREHSRVHIGELQRHADPTSNSDRPNETVTVEVDYYQGVRYEPLNTSSWGRGIEHNFAFYGLNVDVIRDESIDNEFEESGSDLRVDELNLSNGVTLGDSGPHEIGLVHEEDGRAGQADTDEYTLVGPNEQNPGPYGPLAPNATGKNPEGETIALFVPNIWNETQEIEPPVQTSPYESEVGFRAAVVIVHEIGHSYDLGEADDDFQAPSCTENLEAYSGDDCDLTPETIWVTAQRSVMRRGSGSQMYSRPLDGTYFIVSIEELLTLQNDG